MHLSLLSTQDDSPSSPKPLTLPAQAASASKAAPFVTSKGATATSKPSSSTSEPFALTAHAPS